MYENQSFSNSLFAGWVNNQKNDSTLMTITVSDFSQIAMYHGLAEMSKAVVMYVEIVDVYSEMPEDELKRRTHDLLLRKTLAGEFPWNSILFKDAPEEVSSIPSPTPEQYHSMKDRWAGRVRTDRAIQYRDD